MPINKASAIVTELDDISTAFLDAVGFGIGQDMATIDDNIAVGVDRNQLTVIDTNITQLENDVVDLNNNSGGVLDIVNAIDTINNTFASSQFLPNASNNILRAIMVNPANMYRGSQRTSTMGSFIEKVDIDSSTMNIVSRKAIPVTVNTPTVNDSNEVLYSVQFNGRFSDRRFGKLFGDGTFLAKSNGIHQGVFSSLINNVTLIDPNTGRSENIHQPLGAAYQFDNGTTNWSDGGELVGVVEENYGIKYGISGIVAYSINIDGHPGKHVFSKYAGSNLITRVEVDFATSNVTYLKNVIYDSTNDSYYGVLIELDSNTANLEVPYDVTVVKLDSNFSLVWRSATVCSYTTGSGNDWSLFGISYPNVYRITVDESNELVYMVGHSADMSPPSNLDTIFKLDSAGNIVPGDSTTLPYSVYSVERRNSSGDLIMLSNTNGKELTMLLFDSSTLSVTESAFYESDFPKNELVMSTTRNSRSIGTSLDFSDKAILNSITVVDGFYYVASIDVDHNLYFISADDSSISTKLQMLVYFHFDTNSRPRVKAYTLFNNKDIMAIGKI